MTLEQIKTWLLENGYTETVSNMEFEKDNVKWSYDSDSNYIVISQCNLSAELFALLKSKSIPMDYETIVSVNINDLP